MKTATALLLSLSLLFLLPFPAMAAPTRTAASPDMNDNLIISPFYLNISLAYVACSNTQITTSLDSYSKMNLTIAVKVYKNGKLDFSGSASKTAVLLVYEPLYNFTSGNSYKVVTTFTAGSETTQKELSFSE